MCVHERVCVCVHVCVCSVCVCDSVCEFTACVRVTGLGGIPVFIVIHDIFLYR